MLPLNIGYVTYRFNQRLKEVNCQLDACLFWNSENTHIVHKDLTTKCQ